MTIGDLPLAAQIGVAIVTAFAWFAATCFFGGFVIGLFKSSATCARRAICARHDFQNYPSFTNSRATPIVALDGELVGGARRASNERSHAAHRIKQISDEGGERR